MSLNQEFVSAATDLIPSSLSAWAPDLELNAPANKVTVQQQIN